MVYRYETREILYHASTKLNRNASQKKNELNSQWKKFIIVHFENMIKWGIGGHVENFVVIKLKGLYERNTIISRLSNSKCAHHKKAVK